MSVVLADSCRLCLETSALSAIFGSEGDVSVTEKAMDCLDIKLEENDGLPPLICRECEDHLNKFYEFRQRCRTIDKKLRTRSLEENDGLPLLICRECEDHLNKFYEFRQKCRTIDKKLRTRSVLTQSSKIKQENGDSSSDSWKLEMKPELDGLIINGFDHLGDWLPEDSKISEKLLQYGAVKHEESLAESLQRTLDYELQESEILDKLSDNAPGHDAERRTETFPRDAQAESEAKKKQSSVQCELCGKIFKYKATLKKHLRSHTGVKLFSCKLCHKRFTRAEHEIVHMRAHRGIRPFICEMCARGFTKRQDLLRHMRIHSDEKKFACPRCERKFKRSGDVRSHMRSHTGLKPYACVSCHKAYSSHSGLKKHHRAHCSKPLEKPA